MGDMGDDFRAWKQAKVEEKRAANRQSGADLLRSKGIEFEERNHGAHLLVRHEGRTIDYWPGTGKWIDKAHPFSCIYGRGVFQLLKRLGDKPRGDGDKFYRCGACRRGKLQSWDKECKVCGAKVVK